MSEQHQKHLLSLLHLCHLVFYDLPLRFHERHWRGKKKKESRSCAVIKSWRSVGVALAFIISPTECQWADVRGDFTSKHFKPQQCCFDKDTPAQTGHLLMNTVLSGERHGKYE